jgi:hypothetical protein
MRSFITCILFARYNYNAHVKEDEMEKTGRIHERGEEWIRVFMGKQGGKRPLGIPRHGGEDNTKRSY